LASNFQHWKFFFLNIQLLVTYNFWHWKLEAKDTK
jgi:hypothetical protein